MVSIVGVAALDRQPLFVDWQTKEWLLSVMVALVGILGSILMTKAVCWVTPSKVTAAISIHGAETAIFPNLVSHVCKSPISLPLAVMLLAGSKVMVVRSFEVVAAYILQVTVFDVATHWTDLAGTACVISAVVMMGLEDIIMERLDWRFL